MSERTEDGTADDMVANPLSRAYGKRPLSAEPRKLPSTPKVDASPVKERYSTNEMDAPSFRTGRRSRCTNKKVKESVRFRVDLRDVGSLELF